MTHSDSGESEHTCPAFVNLPHIRRFAATLRLLTLGSNTAAFLPSGPMSGAIQF